MRIATILSYLCKLFFKSGELVRKSALVKRVKGFQTGDIVKAVVTGGKKIGSYLGKVAVRSSGSFNIKTTYCHE